MLIGSPTFLSLICFYMQRTHDYKWCFCFAAVPKLLWGSQWAFLADPVELVVIRQSYFSLARAPPPQIPQSREGPGPRQWPLFSTLSCLQHFFIAVLLPQTSSPGAAPRLLKFNTKSQGLVFKGGWRQHQSLIRSPMFCMEEQALR